MGQLFFFAILGFVSAIPFMLVGGTLQAWGTTGSLNLMTLGCLTLIGQPYAFKFLWAPLVDRFSLPFFSGHYRSWMLVLLLLLFLTFGLLSFSHLPGQLLSFLTLAFIAAIFSATLDIAIDAYRTEQLPQALYGLGNAMYVSAYRLGALVAGGLALILADNVGWRFTYQLMALIILVGFFVVLFSKEVEHKVERMKLPWHQQFLLPLQDLWQREFILGILIFILLYKFGEAMGTALTSTFLLRGLHFSLTIVGTAYKTVALIATILGAFLGGYFYKKYTLFGTLLVYGILQALGVLLYVWLALVGKNLPLMATCMAVENFTAGMATTVFLALLMKLCREPFIATQYALLSALASLGRIFTGPLAGKLVEIYQWEGYFIASFLMCLPALMLLIFLRSSFKRL